MSRPERLRAPRADGALLEAPPLAETGRLLAENRRRLAHPVSLLDRPLAELRRRAEIEVRAAAADYLAAAGEPHPPGLDAPLILAGHQPELFHPGVWIKNFALAGLAERHGLVAVNLVVDNDTAKSPALRLPAQDPANPNISGIHLATVPFDQLTPDMPYEERTVANEDLFASFPERVEEVLRPWVFQSMLPDFWAEVLRKAKRTPLVGERFAAARRTFERRWGCHNLELPVSRLCGTTAFGWFACHLLADAARFHEVHNTALAEHRRVHRIRSKNHPVPDLAGADGWHEAPFWGWRAGQHRRGRLFVRRDGARLELRAGDEAWPTLPLGLPAQTVAAFGELAKRGFKVRTRALTTTLFARLVVGELFIHGIGGGKYDELTDEIIRRYFGIEPPEFIVVSGTLLLPLPAFPDARTHLQSAHRALRALRYNPDQFLDGSPLVTAKADLVRRHPLTRAERRERFVQIRSLNDKMQAPVARMVGQQEGELAEARAELKANAVSLRRDYAFCLFPEAKLKPFCTQFFAAPEPALAVGST